MWTVRRFGRDAQVGNFIWTRDLQGRFRLGQLAGPYRYVNNAKARATDTHQVRRCDWAQRPLGDLQVPGGIIRAFSGTSSSFERIHDEGARRYTAWLWDDLHGREPEPLGFTPAEVLAQLEPYDLEDLIYMRARAYDSLTGQFLTRDPIEALTHQPYSYTADNPANGADPAGLWLGTPLPSPGEVVHTVAHVALDLAAVRPYAHYYAANKLAHAINSVGDQLGVRGEVVAHTLNIPLALIQARGLCQDALIDWVKGHTVNDESIRDEGIEEYINPLHSYLPPFLRGPKTYLPGIHENGSVDLEW